MTRECQRKSEGLAQNIGLVFFAIQEVPFAHCLGSHLTVVSSTSQAAMAKRTAEDDVADFEKKMNKQQFTQASKTLRKQYQANPDRAFITAQLLQGLACQPAPSTRDKRQEDWPNTYGTIAKFPRVAKHNLLLQTVPNLKESWLQLWRCSEKEIVEHLFEFQFCIAPEFTWPQGPCHRKGMLEKVAERWAKHLEKVHTEGQKRLEAIQAEEFQAGPAFNWNRLGVYIPIPHETTVKTHILHKLSGQRTEIPQSMHVDDTWTISNNWSDHRASLVDGEGYEVRQISTFFGLTDVGMTMKDWVALASYDAKNLAEEEDHPNVLAQAGLAIVMGLQSQGLTLSTQGAGS
jgi:hypothetical protein